MVSRGAGSQVATLRAQSKALNNWHQEERQKLEGLGPPGESCAEPILRPDRPLSGHNSLLFRVSSLVKPSESSSRGGRPLVPAKCPRASVASPTRTSFECRERGDWFTFYVQWVWCMDTFRLAQMKSTVAEWSLKAQFALLDPPP